jgi:hypothetical protein
LVGERLARDWQGHFGHPVLAVETLVDPQRSKGTCYKAAGWQPLGPTQGYERSWQDFYTDTKQPKELWVKALSPRDLEQLQAPELPPTLLDPAGPLPPPCPVATGQLHSLWERFRWHLTDPRKPKGVLHLLATLLTLVALARAAGCQGPHAMAEFARSLNHGQRRHGMRLRIGCVILVTIPLVTGDARSLLGVEPRRLNKRNGLVVVQQPGFPAKPFSLHRVGSPVVQAPADYLLPRNAKPAAPQSHFLRRHMVPVLPKQEGIDHRPPRVLLPGGEPADSLDGIEVIAARNVGAHWN